MYMYVFAWAVTCSIKMASSSGRIDSGRMLEYDLGVDSVWFVGFEAVFRGGMQHLS